MKPNRIHIARFGLALPAVLLGALVSAVPAAAQQSLMLGVKGGVNFGHNTVEDRLVLTGDPTSSTNFAGGGVIETALGRGTFSILTEVIYTRRESTFHFAPALGLPGIDAVYKLDFLEVPFMLKATFGHARCRPYVFLGPNAIFRLSAESTNTAAGVTQTFNVNDQIHAVNLAVDAGGGFAFGITPAVFLTGDVRYSHMITNMARTTGDDWKTRDVRVLVGVLFGVY